MKTLIDSLKAQITEATGRDAYFGDINGSPDYPYVLLWSSAGRLEQNTLAGATDLAERLGVTMVATTTSNVLTLSGHVRDALVGFTPTSDTWRMSALRDPYDSQNIQVDRDVALPNRGYPSFVVDMYWLHGTRQ